MDKFEYKPIGIIHTPFNSPQGTPIQPAGARGTAGRIEVFPEFASGLADLNGFSHIYIIYHFHLSKAFSLTVTPFLDDQKRGLFATRAPSRPNPIGISVVRLVGISKGSLQILDVDVVDGTPLLDIKPYVPEFDVCQVERTGWLGQKMAGIDKVRDDGRFS